MNSEIRSILKNSGLIYNARNVFHAKAQIEDLHAVQELYILQAMNPGLHHANLYCNHGNPLWVHPLDIPEPPRFLHEMEKVQLYQNKWSKMIKDREILIRSTDGFKQIKPYRDVWNKVMLFFSNHVEEFFPYLHREEDHIWFTYFNISSPITWSGRWLDSEGHISDTMKKLEELGL